MDVVGSMGSEKIPWWKILPLVASNVAFVLPAGRAIQMTRHVQAFIYICIVFASSFYHLCKGGWVDEPGDGGICFIFTFDQFYSLDFFFAQLPLPLTGLFLINFNPIYDAMGNVRRGHLWGVEQWLIYGYTLAIGIGLMLVDPDVHTFISLIASILSTVVIMWSHAYVYYNDIPHFNKRGLGLSLAVGGIALGLIISQKVVSGEWYWITHSIWHVLGACGQYYLLETRRKRTIPRSGEKRARDDLYFQPNKHQGTSGIAPFIFSGDSAFHRPCDLDGAKTWELPLHSLWEMCDW